MGPGIVKKHLVVFPHKETRLNPALRELLTRPLESGLSAHKHSRDLDRSLGFEIPRIEEELLRRAKERRPSGNMKTWGEGIHQGSQSWVGLDPQTLQTPYSELLRICELLDPGPGSTVVDLGAGYGRMGLVLGARCREVSFIGFELVPERVREGRRILREHGCTHATLLEQDLTDPDFEVPLAEVYFLYDYGKVEHIRRTLAQLSAIADRKNFQLVARGMGARSLIENEHPWLSDVYPVHREENFSIYSMSPPGSLAGAGPRGRG